MATACTYSLIISLILSFFILNSASSEADILLTFKASIEDSKNALSSWSNASATHYCNWTGIACVSTPSLSVTSLNLQSLNLSGEISSSICELPYLSHLNLADNVFNKPIPLHLSECNTLETLNLSNNLIWGPIPSQISQFGSLKVLDLSGNHVEGKIPESMGSLQNLEVLNLGSNLLSELKKCRKLVSLSLADNSLTGEIPPSLSDLPVLTYLDLSDNNLSGPIPQGLQNLKLALFNVSFNQLSGRVPFSLISGLPASFLEGNPELCGPGLSNSCSDDQPRHRTAGLATLTYALISVAFGLGTLIVAAGFFLYHRYSKQRSQMGSWRMIFFYPLRVTEHELVMGMNEMSAVGSGAFGRVYILGLPSGELVAIKKLVNYGSQSFKSLKAEIRTLAKIRHKNIVKILGFCRSDDSILLIYEFLQKGSLGDLIHRPGFVLQWDVRLRIAIGVAQGLAYLQKDYAPHLLHRNLKSNNILLDADFEPKLTDFALDIIVGEAAFQSTMASETASSCYNAPECGYSKKATEQMDVYSFGVVLLELVSGRKAEQAEPAESLDIVKWVRRKVNITNGAYQVLDPNISESSQQEMLWALEIAMGCTSVMPEKRPSMFEVVRALQSLDSRTSFPSNTSEGHSISL
ncbi:hypothetical protein I3760_09G033600 [Carya illinoinensis]|nr:hypothetical protein I3760_09G033600 [Carya illinoinensis]